MNSFTSGNAEIGKDLREQGNGSLCSTCESFLFHGNERHISKKDAISSDTIVPSVCAMCAALDECLSWVEQEYSISRNDAWIRLQVNKTYAITIDGRTFSGWFSGRHACESCTTTFPAFPAYSPPTDKVYLGISPEERLSWAAATFDECCHSPIHKACQREPEGTQPPTRLLELQGTGLNTTKCAPYLRLIETAEQHLSGALPYASLSHCWGPPGRLTVRTTCANYEEMKTGISLEKLPQTFQDAVRITNELGLRYLWIDSLCIIQDHPHDWSRECVKMGSVYSGAEVVITAIAAQDCHAGCMQPWPKAIEFLAKSSGNDAELHRFTLNYSTPHDGMHYAVCNDSATAVYKHSPEWKYWPLLSRGWAFQERQLARRILYCAKGEFVWKCSQGTASMCEHASDGPHPQAEDEHVQWKSLVDSYCGSLLTYYSDRLPAFAGLAERKREAVKIAGGGQYLAGVWSDWLGRPGWQLLWRVEKDDEILPLPPRGQKWRAPTWSWASVDFNAQTPFYAEDLEGYIQLFQVLEADVSCEGGNAFAQPISGHIEIRGMIAPYRLGRDKPTNIAPFEGCPSEYLPGIFFADVRDFQTSTYSFQSPTFLKRSNLREITGMSDIVFVLFMMRSEEVDLVEALVLRCLDDKFTPELLIESLREEPAVSSKDKTIQGSRNDKGSYTSLVENAIFERVGLIMFQQWPSWTLESANMERSSFMADIHII